MTKRVMTGGQMQSEYKVYQYISSENRNKTITVTENGLIFQTKINILKTKILLHGNILHLAYEIFKERTSHSNTVVIS